MRQLAVVMVVGLVACEPDVPPSWQPVVEVTLERLSFDPPDLLLEVDGQHSVGLWARFSDGSVENVTAEARFWSADDAIVSASNEPGRRGSLSARAAGATQVWGEFGALRVSLPIRVRSAEPVRLIVSPSSARVAVGQRAAFEVLVERSDGSREVVSSELSWRSMDASIARPEASSFVGLKAGSAQLEVSWRGLSGSSSLQVTAAAVTSVVVRPQSPMLQRGEKVALTALAFFSDGSSRDVTREARWSSSNSDIAVVSLEGEAVGRFPGATVVGAAWQGIFGSTLLTVAGAPPTTLELLPLTPIVPLGATKQLFAVAGFADGSTEDSSEYAVWQSSNPAIVSVSNDAPGLMVAHAGGQVRLDVTLRGLSASTVITVVTAPVSSLEFVAAAVHVGERAPFEVLARFADGQTVDVTAHATWSSATPAIGTITNSASSRGLFTGVQPGTTVVSVSWSGRSTSRVVTVLP